MPLKYSLSKGKKSINAAVSSNIHELVHHGTKKRSMKQIIAIAENAARHKRKSK